jgi:hypothetical protein
MQLPGPKRTKAHHFRVSIVNLHSTGMLHHVSTLPSPFVAIDGVINIRSIGGYPTPSRSLLRSPSLFRSGELSGITSKGKDQLVSLGIHRVFDLRSDVEIAGYATSTPVVDGIEFVRVPVSKTRAFDPVDLAPRYVFTFSITFVMSHL